VTVSNSKVLISPLLIIGVVFFSSWWARRTIVGTFILYERIVFIKDFFSITSVRNSGVAFGLFSEWDAAFRVPFLLGATSMALSLIVYLLIKSQQEHWMVRWGFSLLAGGAVGNFYERVIYGEVVDYFDFYLGNYHWPTFNISDVSILTGIGLVLLYYYVLRKEENEHADDRK
jgi:signal peptidase II